MRRMKCPPDPGPANMLHFEGDLSSRPAVRLIEVEGVTNDEEARGPESGIQSKGGNVGHYGAADGGGACAEIWSACNTEFMDGRRF